MGSPVPPARPPLADGAVPSPSGPTLSGYLRRLVWWSMLPVLLVALALAAEGIWRLYEADNRTAEALARQMAQHADDVLQDRAIALQLLAESPLLAEGRLAEFHRRAKVFRTHLGSELLLGDAQGRMLLHTGVPFGDPLPPLPLPRGRAAVPAVLESGRPAVGDLFVGPIQQRAMVAVAVPVPPARPGEPPDKALLTALDVDVFAQQMRSTLLPPDWQAALRDSGARSSPCSGLGRRPVPTRQRPASRCR
jgi:hypothetical protein